jgi:hypothetical protein
VPTLRAANLALKFLVKLGALAAPNSERRLPAVARLPFELAVFGLAVVALAAAGSTVVAVVFAVLIVLNAALLTVLDQWEQ